MQLARNFSEAEASLHLPLFSLFPGPVNSIHERVTFVPRLPKRLIRDERELHKGSIKDYMGSERILNIHFMIKITSRSKLIVTHSAQLR
jgi:hypothetical protein